VKAINFKICIINCSRRSTSKRLGERIILPLCEKGLTIKAIELAGRMAGR